MPRITARRTRIEPGLAGVCQAPRGYEISITGYGQVASVFALNKGWHEYCGWTYLIFKRPELNLPRIEAWHEAGIVARGKTRYFKYTDEGRDAAKRSCINRIKSLIKS